MTNRMLATIPYSPIRYEMGAMLLSQKLAVLFDGE
jgi:hypothetical protein